MKLPYIISIATLLLATSLTHTMEKKVKGVHDIGFYCAHLAKKVSKQPIFEGRAGFDETCQVLPLDNCHDPKICEIVYENAKRIGKEKEDIFGFEPHDLISTAHGRSMHQGIILVPHGDHKISVKKLKHPCNRVIELLQRGWKRSTATKHPTIKFKKDEQDWNLYSKPCTLIEEDILICYLAHKFKMHKEIICYSEWLQDCDSIYLWIKKDALDAFKEIFNFEGIRTVNSEGCIICTEPLDEYYDTLPCGHNQFCVHCIEQWKELNPTCPLCRATLHTNDEIIVT